MASPFATRLRAGDKLLATFIKTPSMHAVEIAGVSGLDAVVLDAEHAPFSSDALDQALLACRAAGIAGIVRVPDSRPQTIGQVLDMGAAGVLIPHICSAADAQAAVAAARYRGGARGFSNSPRAGSYGASTMLSHIDAQDADVLVLCQIEDRAAVENVEEIAAVSGVDCLFVGRADLAVSYAVYDLDHALVTQAQLRIFAAAHKSKVSAGIFVGTAAPLPALVTAGGQFLVVGSDQSILRSGFDALRRALPKG
jgi:2-keto-3-deoxy-L-rhamnonate aldolase RhmA